MCCGGLTLLLPFGAARDGNSYAGRSQGLCQQIFATLTGCGIQVSHSALDELPGTLVMQIARALQPVDAPATVRKPPTRATLRAWA